MTTELALIGLVFLPLVMACLAFALGPRARFGCTLLGLLPLPALLWYLTGTVLEQEVLHYAMAGWTAPLGIQWRLDPLALALLWLVALISLFGAWHARGDFPPDHPRAQYFWPLWLLLTAGLNALFLSADLFNLYVCLELITLAAIPLIAITDTPEALRAAMRYLLLALLGSLAYLLGVVLVYNASGTLDLYQLADMELPASGLQLPLALMSSGLLLKAAVFPLHSWLPPAHGNAPAAVSAVLSALVVKSALYLLYRIWFWSGADADVVATLLAVLGAAAILYGSIQALLQQRLKLIVAYSTVAQLGYLLLIFGLPQPLAWQGTGFQLISHGVAKAALFLAAGNVLHALGRDDLPALAGLDRRMPLTVFAFVLAAVSIMGLPPSGGFIAKWLLLQAAWQGEAWGIFAVLVAGGLLAAAYLFRALAAMIHRGNAESAAAERPGLPASQPISALLLALIAIALGLAAAPVGTVLERLGTGATP